MQVFIAAKRSIDGSTGFGAKHFIELCLRVAHLLHQFWTGIPHFVLRRQLSRILPLEGATPRLRVVRGVPARAAADADTARPDGPTQKRSEVRVAAAHVCDLLGELISRLGIRLRPPVAGAPDLPALSVAAVTVLPVSHHVLQAKRLGDHALMPRIDQLA